MATVSLLHFNGADASTTFADETGKVWAANGNAQLDTAQKKFGTAAGLFDGTGDYISNPGHADFAFGTGPFTFDFWVRFNVIKGCEFFRIVATNAFYIGLSTEPTRYSTVVAAGSVNFYPSPALTTNQWYHLAFVRDASGTTYFFQDGVLLNTSYPSQSGDANHTATTRIGYVANCWIDEFRVSDTALWAANFTPPTSEYKLGLSQNVVIESPENIREVINRIAYEASSMEYWDAGQHNLVYLPTHTTVSKTIDANRIDLGTISVGYTDRVDLLNSMTLWYQHYWSGYSGDAAFRKSVSDSDATSITEFGTLSSEPLQFQYLGDTDDTLTLGNAQRALRWILTQQKNPRVTIEFTGGYYLTDLRRSNLIQFSFASGDELDKAFSGLVSTSDKFIITDIVRGTGQIKIKAVQLIAL